MSEEQDKECCEKCKNNCIHDGCLCGTKPMCPCHQHPTPEIARGEEIKKWFENNYLDGDNIQNGQMLSSEECLDAVSTSYTKGREDIREVIKERLDEMKKVWRKWDESHVPAYIKHEVDGYNQALHELKQFLLDNK